MQNSDLAKIRNEYLAGELDITHVHPDPVRQFGIWMDQALRAEIDEPTAMTLATVSRDGKPSARMVLLKGFSEIGFVFYTNYNSRKADEIAKNHRAALVLYWKELERQVRIEGSVIKTSGKESDEYFLSRPLESQVSAIISPQSQPIPGREYLDNLRRAYLQGHTGGHVRPTGWGGYVVIPEVVEFWQGRRNRLHDRIRYFREKDSWKMERLAP